MSDAAGETALLGSGNHGLAILKRAVKSVYDNLAKLVSAGTLLQKGTHWKSEGGERPLLYVCSTLFGISDTTVKRYLSQANKAKKASTLVPGPKKRGAPAASAADTREKYSDLFDLIVLVILEARKDGDTVHIDKLLGKVNSKLYEDEEPMTYDQLRYYMLKMGFSFGRVSRQIKSGRHKPYVVSWLVRYCTMRYIYKDKGGQCPGGF